MNCRIMMDKVYDSIGEGPLPLGSRLQLGVHRCWCPRCNQAVKTLEAAQELMETQFFPPSPDFEEIIMAQISAQDTSGVVDYAEAVTPYFDVPAGVSFRGWVITGLIILFSLSTSFFGMDFKTIAGSQGSSFLLPVGLTIGSVVTVYGALFIGSHLKELSGRFRLH
ncbi:MAG: peptidoglycan-binding protein [Treponema sp.]|jgi:hypothetical protein|nr:peptidoglycan-binding protein [Treponema sp.]